MSWGVVAGPEGSCRAQHCVARQSVLELVSEGLSFAEIIRDYLDNVKFASTAEIWCHCEQSEAISKLQVVSPVGIASSHLSWTGQVQGYAPRNDTWPGI
jgi:hypothetical protein